MAPAPLPLPLPLPLLLLSASALLLVGWGDAFLAPPRRPGGGPGGARQASPLLAKAAGGRAAEPEDPRRLALEGVMNQIERCYGRGSILTLGETGNIWAVETTSTGSLTLDLALGGGLPKGRVVEIYGPESSGKTTLALHALAEVQKLGGVGAFIDAEHALDPAYASRLGVDVEGLLVSQPDSGEMALDIVDQLVRSSAVDMVVVDSVAALVPRAELEGDMADVQMGLQARLMSKALRKVTGSLSKSTCTVVFLNQLRSKIGVIYGSPEVTSGGNALKYYSSVRLDVRRKETMRDNTGITVKVKVAKNKVAPPFRTVELDIIFGKGIDRVASMLDAAELSGLVVRKGSWYSYGGKNIGQGRLNTLEYFKANPDQEVELELAVREALKEAELPPVGKVIVESANGDDDDVPPEMEDEDATPPLFDSVVAAVDA